jgi:hypothetical protein
MTGPSTRRQLVGRLLAGSGTVSAGVALAGLATAAPAAAAALGKTDAQITADLLAVELLVAAVYTRTLASGHLSPRGMRLARPLLVQERAHAAALGRELRVLGGAAPVGPTTLAAVDRALSDRHVSRRVEDLHSERGCLQLLLDVESIAQGAYYTAMAKLQSRRLLLLSAQILASEAQHEAVLGELLRPKDLSVAVPYPFVEGTY